MARIEQIGRFDFQKKMNQLQKMKSDLPVRCANAAKNYFIEQFRMSQWDGRNWQPRKDLRNTKKLLVKSGRLQKALYNSLKKTSWNGILFHVDSPYAAVHNNGLMSGRGAGFKMPKRQFIGDSVVLRKKIRTLVEMAFKQAMK